jgi:hypothetical protein
MLPPHIFLSTLPCAAIMSPFADLPAWPYIFVATLPFWMIGVFIVAQTPAVHAMCDQVGFPQPRSQPLNSFFWLFVNKEGCMGLIMLLLQLAGEWRAVGIVLSVMCIGGAGDLYLSIAKGRMGLVEAFQAHGVMTGVGVWAAWRILDEHGVRGP